MNTGGYEKYSDSVLNEVKIKADLEIGTNLFDLGSQFRMGFHEISVRCS